LNPESLRKIGIPKTMYNKSIDDFDTYGSSEYEKVKESVKDYLLNIDQMFIDNVGVTFYGANGVGKSFLASLIIREAYRHRYSAYRLTFANYKDVYTASWNPDSGDNDNEFGVSAYTYKAAEFLCLEEIGKEIDSKITTPILEDLLRYREDKGLPIILCMNLRMSALEDKYGASVASLIKGNTIPIKIEGEDKRGQYFKKRGFSET